VPPRCLRHRRASNSKPSLSAAEHRTTPAHPATPFRSPSAPEPTSLTPLHFYPYSRLAKACKSSISCRATSSPLTLPPLRILPSQSSATITLIAPEYRPLIWGAPGSQRQKSLPVSLRRQTRARVLTTKVLVRWIGWICVMRAGART